MDEENVEPDEYEIDSVNGADSLDERIACLEHTIASQNDRLRELSREISQLTAQKTALTQAIVSLQDRTAAATHEYD